MFYFCQLSSRVTNQRAMRSVSCESTDDMASGHSHSQAQRRHSDIVVSGSPALTTHTVHPQSQVRHRTALNQLALRFRSLLLM